MTHFTGVHIAAAMHFRVKTCSRFQTCIWGAGGIWLFLHIVPQLLVHQKNSKTIVNLLSMPPVTVICPTLTICDLMCSNQNVYVPHVQSLTAVSCLLWRLTHLPRAVYCSAEWQNNPSRQTFVVRTFLYALLHIPLFLVAAHHTLQALCSRSLMGNLEITQHQQSQSLF